MAEDPSKSRLARALGAGLLVVVGIAALWAGEQRWMRDASPAPIDPREVRLDLADAFRFAASRAGVDGARPARRDERIVVPPGAEVAWSVRVPPAPGGLGAAGIEAPTAAEGGAELVVESDGGARRSRPLAPCVARCRIELDDFAGRVVRLTVRGPRAGSRPLALVSPVLYGPPPLERAAGEAPSTPPPVIVYLMDTLRADKLGAYGNAKGFTPEIDAFAREATVFEDTIAQASWTKPSVASLFTGLFARVHRILKMPSVLPDSARTLAELFHDHGYATAAVVTNGLVDADFGFDQGFDHFVRAYGRAPDVEGITGFRADKPAIDSDVAQAAVWPWLDERAADEPFLLYVHVLDPHVPHFPPEPYKGRFVPELDRFDLGSMESVRRMDEMDRRGEPVPPRERAQLETLYDAEIAHNDHQFGLLLGELRARGLYDAALIVLVSDHGEAFWEHGHRGHGKSLYEELLRVPLVIKAPHQTEGRRVRSLAQHVDLLPTLADYAGIPVPGGLHGRSLRPLIELGDGAIDGEPPAIGVSAGEAGTAIRQGRFKLVKHKGGTPPLALYDLEVDPGERRNVVRSHPILVRYLLEEVARVEARSSDGLAPSEPVERELTREKEAELRALGYLE